MHSLLLQRLTALSGPVGLVFVAYVAFVAIYGVLVSLTDDGPVVVDAVMTVLMATCAVLALGALAVVVGFTFARGGPPSGMPISIPRTCQRPGPWPR